MSKGPRTATAYLTIEDRRPRTWQQEGNAMVTAVHQSMPRGEVAAGSRIVKVRLRLPAAMFDAPDLDITVEQADILVSGSGDAVAVEVHQ